MRKQRLGPRERELAPGKDEVRERNVRAVNDDSDERRRGLEPIGAALGRLLARAERQHGAHVKPSRRNPRQ